VGRQHADVLRLIRIIALGVILYILMGTPRRHHLQTVSLAMVMGGALGNIWDSWRYGHVRDFLHFDFGFPPADPWPAFNLADSMICVGVFLLALGMIVSGIAHKKEGSRKDVAGS
jgi:signal peptidase II